MEKKNTLVWSDHPENRLDSTKRLLSRLSLAVRAAQLEIFMREFKPNEKTRLLDVGISPIEDLPDTNFFEKHYPFPASLTAIGVEDCSGLQAKYSPITVVQSKAGETLPFTDGVFDIVTSWATLEHVGSFEKQAFFLRECLRIGKKVFITVPYRGCVYEPHSGFFFVHWLPLGLFRKICAFRGKTFWADPNNLNPLFVRDIQRMTQDVSVRIRVYRMFNLLSSHLIITKT